MSLRKIEKEQIQELLQDTETEQQDQEDVVVLKVKTRVRAGDKYSTCCRGTGGGSI
jgi:hypothetical protein